MLLLLWSQLKHLFEKSKVETQSLFLFNNATILPLCSVLQPLWSTMCLSVRSICGTFSKISQVSALEILRAVEAPCHHLAEYRGFSLFHCPQGRGQSWGSHLRVSWSFWAPPPSPCPGTASRAPSISLPWRRRNAPCCLSRGGVHAAVGSGQWVDCLSVGSHLICQHILISSVTGAKETLLVLGVERRAHTHRASAPTLSRAPRPKTVCF